MRMTPREVRANQTSTENIGSSLLAGVSTKVLFGDPSKAFGDPNRSSSALNPATTSINCAKLHQVAPNLDGIAISRPLFMGSSNSFESCRGLWGLFCGEDFVEDFSGRPGRLQRTIGGDVFHPDQFRQSYFFQDAWKTVPSLTMTLGLRYENFGQPVNALSYPAFTGFDPNLFYQPNRVNTVNRDFGPAPLWNSLNKLRNGTEIGDFVFPSRTGKALDRGRVRVILRKAEQETGVADKTPQVGPHWLRRAHAPWDLGFGGCR